MYFVLVNHSSTSFDLFVYCGSSDPHENITHKIATKLPIANKLADPDFLYFAISKAPF